MLAGAAQAHKPSDSYLTVTVQDGRLRGQWDIALRDLDLAVGLDADGDGRITWGELRTRWADVLLLGLGGVACTAAYKKLTP